MAKSDKNLQAELDNSKTYSESVKNAFHEEMKLYEDFYAKITHHATTHRQITFNNLAEIKEKLEKLKTEAKSIKDSLFYHEEYEIVDRQEIIATTENGTHRQNESFLEYHYQDKADILNSLDYLNKALIQTRTSFFESYQRYYLKNIFENESFFNYFLDASKEFNEILDRHQSEILELFLRLDEEIKNMDNSISQIIKRKNRTVSKSNRFFEEEMKNFIDNQLLFSAESDPTSIDIQALISDKIHQFETIKSHIAEEDKKISSMFRRDYQELYQQVLARQLTQKSNLISEKLSFFDDPESSLKELKMRILSAKEQGNNIALKDAINLYQKAKKHLEIRKQAEKKSAKLIINVETDKRSLLKEYRISTNRILMELERYLDLFQSLMNKDTFLAQAIGDYSSKIIKDELNRLSILQLNKELKTNINYDIESLKIKSKINEIELEMTYVVKKQMVLQEIELLDTIAQAQQFLLYNKAKFVRSQLDIKKDAWSIGRLEKAMNVHLDYLHATSNISRTIQSQFFDKVIRQIRSEETHHIHVQAAASKVKLVLKEFDIKALHFKTMMENEMAYIVMQSSRVNEENLIHHEFILTTYQNQMRFSKEQIELADNEYRLRVEAIQRTINEEKTYFEDLIRNKMRGYEKTRKQVEDEYESKLYQNRNVYSQTEDSKIHKILDKEAKVLKKNHDEFMSKWLKDMTKDPVVESAKRRIRELQEDFIDAMEDALSLRDETLLQMADIYEDAKSHYHVLKPFLDNKMNVLDPEFYHAVERINKRFSYKLKLAEAILDEESKGLLEEYLKVYFEPQELVEVASYEPLLTQLTTAREEERTKYEQKMQQIEDEFKADMSLLDQEEIKFDESMILIEQAQKFKFDTTKKQLETDADNISTEYEAAKQNHNAKRNSSIQTLTTEYETALIKNRKYIESLSLDFSKLLGIYEPYIKTQKKDPLIRKILSGNHKTYRKRLKKSEKQIISESKSIQFIKKNSSSE